MYFYCLASNCLNSMSLDSLLHRQLDSKANNKDTFADTGYGHLIDYVYVNKTLHSCLMLGCRNKVECERYVLGRLEDYLPST